MGTSGAGSAGDPPDAWPDEDTAPDGQRHRLDTPRQDLTALARATAPAAAGTAKRQARHEGREDVFAALYADMRATGTLTAAQMDTIVLSIRRRLTPL